MAEEVLYIGIDLGTFRSVMVSSDSHEEEELTVIGTPKDPIARNFLKRDVLFVAFFVTHVFFRAP